MAYESGPFLERPPALVASNAVGAIIMAITRADVAGALKVLNANDLQGRKGHIEKMVRKEHPERHVQKVLMDLESYPEWHARTDLDAPKPVRVKKAK